MPYSSTYDCDSLQGNHVCKPCNDPEFGRVRSTALIKASYVATLMTADPTNATAWTAGVTSGNIVIIPETAGTFDPGDPKVLKGYGESKESYGPRSQTLTFFDPVLQLNFQFYNSITNVRSWVVAFRTSTLIHIADKPASIVAKPKVDDDLESEVIWEVTCKWDSANLPSMHSAVNLDTVFRCASTTTPPVVYDTILSFTTVTTKEAAGVTGTVAATDPKIQINFNAITPQAGTPASMTIKMGTVEVITIDYPTDYSNKPFWFFDANGVRHGCVFTTGTIIVS